MAYRGNHHSITPTLHTFFLDKAQNMRFWKTILMVIVLSVGLGLYSSYRMYGHRVDACEQCGISINPTFEVVFHLKDGTIKR